MVSQVIADRDSSIVKRTLEYGSVGIKPIFDESSLQHERIRITSLPANIP